MWLLFHRHPNISSLMQEDCTKVKLLLKIVSMHFKREALMAVIYSVEARRKVDRLIAKLSSKTEELPMCTQQPSCCERLNARGLLEHHTVKSHCQGISYFRLPELEFPVAKLCSLLCWCKGRTLLHVTVLKGRTGSVPFLLLVLQCARAQHSMVSCECAPPDLPQPREGSGFML